MTALRIINVAIWGAVFLYMVPGAFSAARGKAVRHGDPMRLAVAAMAFVLCATQLRWLLAPENVSLWRALLVLGAANGVYLGLLARAYGRGRWL